MRKGPRQILTFGPFVLGLVAVRSTRILSTPHGTCQESFPSNRLGPSSWLPFDGIAFKPLFEDSQASLRGPCRNERIAVIVAISEARFPRPLLREDKERRSETGRPVFVAIRRKVLHEGWEEYPPVASRSWTRNSVRRAILVRLSDSHFVNSA